MLVLSRKLGESVEIGDSKVIVTVLGIRRSKVQLGVDAPPEIAIHRSEKADLYSGQDSERPRHGSQEPSPAKSRAGRQRNLLLGESILEDLARVQAEIAALAELVPDRDRLVARQVAAEAVERLTAIERTVRFVRRQTSEQPIGAFVGSRSRALQQLHGEETDEADSPSTRESRSWSESCDDSTPLIRESNSSFRVATSDCTPTAPSPEYRWLLIRHGMPIQELLAASALRCSSLTSESMAGLGRYSGSIGYQLGEASDFDIAYPTITVATSHQRIQPE